MFTPFLHIGITDVIDILVVAVLLYTATGGSKILARRLFIRGIFILAVIYILARYLDLPVDGSGSSKAFSRYS